MQLNLNCLVTLTFALCASSALPQDPNGWRRNDSGRRKVLLKTEVIQKSEWLHAFTWSSPAVCTDSIEAAVLPKDTISHRDEYFILGVENDHLKLTFEQSFADKGGGFRKDSTRDLSLPLLNGAFHLYTPDSLDAGLCFKIIPNRPKPGLFEISAVWDAEQANTK